MTNRPPGAENGHLFSRTIKSNGVRYGEVDRIRSWLFTMRVTSWDRGMTVKQIEEYSRLSAELKAMAVETRGPIRNDRC